METLWFSVFPFVNIDSIADIGPPRLYNPMDIMLVLSTFYHSQGTYEKRKSASHAARHFSWKDPKYAAKQMSSPIHFLNDFVLSKASTPVQQIFFRTVNRIYQCSVCDIDESNPKTLEENVQVYAIDRCHESITTHDEAAFASQFNYYNISAPRLIRCPAQDCSNTQATAMDVVTRYSPFLIVESHHWHNEETQRTESTHFPYKLRLGNYVYTMCARVYSTSQGLHFYTVATIHHNGKQAVAMVDNLVQNIRVLSSDTDEFKDWFEISDNTVLVWYKLDREDLMQISNKPEAYHPKQMEMEAVLDPKYSGIPGSCMYIILACAFDFFD